MLPQFRKHRQSTPTALPQPRKHRPSVRQPFRGSGSIVRASDSPSAAQEASSEHPTALPQPRKHRPSVRQTFRDPGSIVGVLDRPSAAQEASSSYSRLMTSAGFSCAARQTLRPVQSPINKAKITIIKP